MRNIQHLSDELLLQIFKRDVQFKKTEKAYKHLTRCERCRLRFREIAWLECFKQIVKEMKAGRMKVPWIEEPWRAKNEHPDDFLIASWICGILPKKERRKIELHLAVCPKCFLSAMDSWEFSFLDEETMGSKINKLFLEIVKLKEHNLNIKFTGCN